MKAEQQKWAYQNTSTSEEWLKKFVTKEDDGDEADGDLSDEEFTLNDYQLKLYKESGVLHAVC